MDARTQAGSRVAATTAARAWTAAAVCSLSGVLLLAAAAAAASPPLTTPGHDHGMLLTRAPGRLIERVVPDEGYRRVSDARRPLQPPPVLVIAPPPGVAEPAPLSAPAALAPPSAPAVTAERLAPPDVAPRASLAASAPTAVLPEPVAALPPATLSLPPPSSEPVATPPTLASAEAVTVAEPAAVAEAAVPAEPAAAAPSPVVAPTAVPEEAAASIAPEPEAPMTAALLAQGAPEPSLQSSMTMDSSLADDRLARASPPRRTPPEADVAMGPTDEPLLQLGPGDAVTVSVFGRPEFNTTTYVSDDGRISVPLAGAIAVAGLSPADAAQRVATALRDGQFLVNPQVSITLTQYRSQTVSVLGEVKAPGRYAIESRTTVFDLLAQAGGVLESGSDVVYLIRSDKKGNSQRHRVDLRTLTSDNPELPRFTLRGGDSLFVPRAERFYVYGEVRSPNYYRLEPGMTVVQAIARGGGLTPRGSEHRIEIKRRKADGKLKTFDADLNDAVQADDVIRVKERIF